MTSFPYTFEQLGPDYRICVSPAHKFGTDAFPAGRFRSQAFPRAGLRPGHRLRYYSTSLVPLGLEPKTAYAVELQDQAFEQLMVTAEGE